jgi:uncharacterized membrane protein
MDSKKKSLYKSFTWPAVHMGFVGTLVYFFEKIISGEAHWEYAGAFAVIYTTCEMLGFFIHERIWAKFGNRVN